jgi:hypothetical protein
MMKDPGEIEEEGFDIVWRISAIMQQKDIPSYLKSKVLRRPPSNMKGDSQRAGDFFSKAYLEHRKEILKYFRPWQYPLPTSLLKEVSEFPEIKNVDEATALSRFSKENPYLWKAYRTKNTNKLITKVLTLVLGSNIPEKIKEELKQSAKLLKMEDRGEGIIKFYYDHRDEILPYLSPELEDAESKIEITKANPASENPLSIVANLPEIQAVTEESVQLFQEHFEENSGISIPEASRATFDLYTRILVTLSQKRIPVQILKDFALAVGPLLQDSEKATQAAARFYLEHRSKNFTLLKSLNETPAAEISKAKAKGSEESSYEPQVEKTENSGVTTKDPTQIVAALPEILNVPQHLIINKMSMKKGEASNIAHPLHDLVLRIAILINRNPVPPSLKIPFSKTPFILSSPKIEQEGRNLLKLYLEYREKILPYLKPWPEIKVTQLTELEEDLKTKNFETLVSKVSNIQEILMIQEELFIESSHPAILTLLDKSPFSLPSLHNKMAIILTQREIPPSLLDEFIADSMKIFEEYNKVPSGENLQLFYQEFSSKLEELSARCFIKNREIIYPIIEKKTKNDYIFEVVNQYPEITAITQAQVRATMDQPWKLKKINDPTHQLYLKIYTLMKKKSIPEGIRRDWKSLVFYYSNKSNVRNFIALPQQALNFYLKHRQEILPYLNTK